MNHYLVKFEWSGTTSIKTDTDGFRIYEKAHWDTLVTKLRQIEGEFQMSYGVPYEVLDWPMVTGNEILQACTVRTLTTQELSVIKSLFGREYGSFPDLDDLVNCHWEDPFENMEGDEDE